MIPLLDLRRLHAPLRQELEAVFSRVIDSGQFIIGAFVERFEAELAAHLGTAHVIGVSSGTDALLAALMALDVSPGDEIITTPYTFFATAGSIVRLGARPVFVDICEVDFNIDVSRIDAAVTSKTVGIVPVHLFGQCANMSAIREIAAERKLWIIEDAAQAIGAQHCRHMAGTMGDIGTFSFFPAKNLGALGDAGAVVTDDERLSERLQVLRSHGATHKYIHDRIGGNFRLDALQAAMLSVKLPHLKKWETKRRTVASNYRAALADVPGLVLPKQRRDNYHVYNQFVLRVITGRRDQLKRKLAEAGVATAIYYPLPLHRQPCFKALGCAEEDLLVAEKIAEQSLALPIDPELTSDDLGKIIDVIRDEVEQSN